MLDEITSFEIHRLGNHDIFIIFSIIIFFSIWFASGVVLKTSREFETW